MVLLFAVQPSAANTRKLSSNPSLLAYAWRVDQGAPFLVSTSRVIFMEEEGDIHEAGLPDVIADVVTSESSTDFSEQMSAELSVDAEYGAFAGAAEANMNSQSSSTTKQLRYDRYIKATKTKLSRASLFPSECLTEEAQRLLAEGSFSNIREELGEFYANEVTLGGVLQLTTFTDMFETDTKKELGASIAGEYATLMASAKATIQGSSSASTTVAGREARTKMRAQGGNPFIWLDLQDDNEISITSKWAESVSEENQYPVGVLLRPLWVLMEQAFQQSDPTRAEAFKQYITKIWEEEGAQIPDYPTKAHSKAWMEPVGIVSSSSMHSNGPIENILDVTASNWANFGGSGVALPAWVIFDFGSEGNAEISRLRMKASVASESPQYFELEFASSSTRAWSVASAMTTSGPWSDEREWSFSEASGRYWRLRFTSTHNGIPPTINYVQFFGYITPEASEASCWDVDRKGSCLRNDCDSHPGSQGNGFPSIYACQSLCQANQADGCEWFAYRHSDGQCWLKTLQGTYVGGTAVQTGPRECPTQSSKPATAPRALAPTPAPTPAYIPAPTPATETVTTTETVTNSFFI
jgi:hypothetical protein